MLVIDSLTCHSDSSTRTNTIRQGLWSGGHRQHTVAALRSCYPLPPASSTSSGPLPGPRPSCALIPRHIISDQPASADSTGRCWRIVFSGIDIARLWASAGPHSRPNGLDHLYCVALHRCSSNLMGGCGDGHFPGQIYHIDKIKHMQTRAVIKSARYNDARTHGSGTFSQPMRAGLPFHSTGSRDLRVPRSPENMAITALDAGDLTISARVCISYFTADYDRERVGKGT